MDDQEYSSGIGNLASATGELAVEIFGQLLERAETRDDAETLQHLISHGARIYPTLYEHPLAQCSLDYFICNALSDLHKLESTDAPTIFAWIQPRLRQAIYHYRRACMGAAKTADEAGRRVQVLVNLGNILSHVGRSFDAVEQYDLSSQLCPTFAMALGNRGFAAMHVARYMYDPSHQFLAMRQAWRDLCDAVQLKETIEPHAIAGFKDAASQIEKCFGVETLTIEPEWPKTIIGACDDERIYRKWCYEKRLFVNDVADLIPPSASALDPTSLPPIVSPIHSPTQLYGLFNLMKQEFVTARWLVYSGLHADAAHFADREVLIYDTLDYPCHSIPIDQVRIALRAAFSVLDKIGLFINEYWKLGHDASQVYFRSVWYERRTENKGLHPAFQTIQNWPLRGLYWLSLDLVDRDMQETLEPESRSLQELRHKLEHQFVKVVEPTSARLDKASEQINVFRDPPLVMYLSRRELEAKAVRVLQLVRRALLHLTMAVKVEEEGRAHGYSFVGELEMLRYPDQMKR